MEIKKVIIEGFRNTAFRKIEFGKGLHLIKGENGVGKTTVIEAVMWCLYGVNLKDENQDALVTKPEYREEDWNGTAVIVKLGNLVVCRSLSHGDYKTGLTIFEDGVDKGFRKIGPAQEFLNTRLQVSSDVFLNSVLFGQRMRRFMDSKPSDKKGIFDELFEADFSEEREKAKARVSEITDEIQTLEVDKRMAEQEITNLGERKQQMQQILQTFEDDKEKSLKELQQKITNCSHRLKGAGIPEDPGEFKREFAKVTLERPQTVLEPVKKEVEDKCPTCGRKLAKTKLNAVKREVEKEYKQQLKQFKEYCECMEDYQKEVERIEQENNKLEKAYKDHQDKVKRYNDMLNESKMIANELALLKERYEEKSNERPPVSKKDVTTLEQRIKKTVGKVGKFDKELIKQEQELENYVYWVKKGFANNGLPAYVFADNLRKAQKYLDKFSMIYGYRVALLVNLEAKSKTFNIEVTKPDGVVFDYSSLSGGEKCRVDNVLAFGLNAYLSSKVDFGVLFMDEFLDGLDEGSLYLTFEVIREIAKDKGVYIVTHTSWFDGYGAHEINFSN